MGMYDGTEAAAEDQGLTSSSSSSSAAKTSFKDSKLGRGLASAGSGLQAMSQNFSANADKLAAENRGVPSYRKGGRVKRTGLIHAHKNEEVVRAEEADKVRRFLKKEHSRGAKSDLADDREDPKRTVKQGDPKRTARKGDPERMGKKEEARKTARQGDPRRMAHKVETRRKAKQQAGRRKAMRGGSRGM